MGFRQGHTAVKVAGRMADQDIRCAAVGNSFHTGVVTLLHMAILSQLPGACLPGVAEVLRKHWREVATQPKEIFSPKPQKHFSSSWDETLEVLEQQSEACPPLTHQVSVQYEQVAVMRKLLEMVGYRGSDVHVDTLAFFR